jgi:Tfp pilus assembly protein PilX
MRQAIRMPSRQTGATLLVVLVMLVVLTLFAVSVINLSNLNARAVGNMQFRKTSEVVAQNVIEQVMSSSANFYSPTAVPTIATNTTQGMTVAVGNRICVATQAATGYSLVQQIVPEDDYWEFQVTVTDPVSSAQTVVHQGAKIRMLANNCPN